MIVDISHKLLRCVQQGVKTMDRGESQGAMLCSGGGGDSGQGRFTRCHLSSRGRGYSE